jgi:hypothetical protein
LVVAVDRLEFKDRLNIILDDEVQRYAKQVSMGNPNLILRS